MDSVWTSDDITFCTSDCNDMKCERNSKHIHHREIPHSYADFEGDKRFCRKAQGDEKEYQPGVWYGADVNPPDARMVLVVGVVKLDNETCVNVYDLGFMYPHGHIWRTFHQVTVKYWMIIPDPPKE